MDTDLTEVWRVELKRGLKKLAEGDAARAEDHFARAYQRAPERPEVCFALGRERLRQGRLDEAEPLLRIAWETDRSLAAAAAALARCLLRIGGRLDDAQAVIDQALTALGDEPGLLVVSAELSLEDGRPDRARAALVRAQASLDASGREASSTREAIQAGLACAGNLEGIQLGRAGRTEEALFAFKRAFDLEPSWAGPLVNMGAIFAQLGRAARARACYERALVMDPRNPVTRFNLASLDRASGDLDAAEAEYRRVLELDVHYPGARIALAEIAMELGRPDAAVEVLRPAVERAPEDPEVQFHLGMALDMCGESAPAEEHLRRALELSPDHVPACCRLALLLGKLGRYLDAAELVRRARQLDAHRAEMYLKASS
jgi:tetratricopeptide (TPR) repeat protein